MHRAGESAEQYLNSVRGVLNELELPQILAAAELVAASLRNGGLIQIFGAGHSLLLAVEVFYRAGGIAAVNPILEPVMNLD